MPRNMHFPATGEGAAGGGGGGGGDGGDGGRPEGGEEELRKDDMRMIKAALEAGFFFLVVFLLFNGLLLCNPYFGTVMPVEVIVDFQYMRKVCDMLSDGNSYL
jgi:hypothetical protein